MQIRPAELSKNLLYEDRSQVVQYISYMLYQEKGEAPIFQVDLLRGQCFVSYYM
jgi:hypothetical protein